MASPRIEPFRLATLALAASALLLVLASPAAARTTRAYTSSFGSFTPGTGGAHSSPGALAVDQSNGDIYAVDTNGSTLKRYTSAGAPDNFTCGTCSGNSLSVSGSVAVDNSGDGLGGDFYVTSGSTVKVFDSTGASLGALTGTAVSGGHFAATCGVAVDDSNGDLYVSGQIGGNVREVWRYAPVSPSGAIDDSDYTFLGGIVDSTAQRPCAIAADHGDLYAADNDSGDNQVRRYSASDFDPSIPTVSGAVVDPGPATALAVDPNDGDLYVDHGNRVNAYDSSGAFLYYFGAAAYTGQVGPVSAGNSVSSGVAVHSSATSGNPAAAAYASDPTTDHQVAAFGPLTLAPTYTHLSIATFGPGGSSATSFSSFAPGKLGFAAAAQRLFALDARAPGPGIYGFDASNPLSGFSPLSGFNPLGTAAFPDTAFSSVPALAVDNTASPSTTTGRLYLASPSLGGTNLLYGFGPAGTPLTGFNPLDPATTTPGGAEASKNLCGAAVDSAGNVYLANAATKHILKYDSTGAYLATIDVSAQGTPCDLAFDSADNLYAVIGNSEPGSGVWRYTAASGYNPASATHIVAQPDPFNPALSIAVDPADDHLFVASNRGDGWVDEFDSAGNLVDEFADDIPGALITGIAVDPTTGDVYLADAGAQKIRVLSPGLLYPEPYTAAASALANATATLNGTISANGTSAAEGVTLSDCKFQYVSLAAYRIDVQSGNDGFSDLSSGGSVDCDQSPGSIPLDLSEHQVTATAGDLTENTDYRFRLIATNDNGSTTSENADFTSAGPPLAQTTGTPLRTATTATLLGRVDPSRALTHYHFEYLTDADYSANGGSFSGPNVPTRAPASPAADISAGSGNVFELASQQVTGLDPDTTYHYRIVADNANPDGPAFGDGFTLTTQANDDPLDHGSYPGPPGSDRAWEMVSLPDSGGNPVNTSLTLGFSDDGDRSIYGVAGGTPISVSGSFLSLYFTQRPAGVHPTSGWQTTSLSPPRDQLSGASWLGLQGPTDLSTTVSRNTNSSGTKMALWRLNADGSSQRLFAPVSPQQLVSTATGAPPFGVASASDRVVATLKGGSLDPAYPSAAAKNNFYDVSSGGTPQLLSILPSGDPPACGVGNDGNGQGTTNLGAFIEGPATAHWVSDDGSLVYFNSTGASCTDPSQLYVRDVAAQTTTRISPPPLSGPTCDVGLIKAIPGAVFFWTQSRLVAQDVDPAAGCAISSGAGTPSSSIGGDVYRYDLAGGALTCLTCLVPNLPADVEGSGPSQISVTDDGSRLYFTADASLLPGTASGSAYRLDLDNPDLAHLAWVPGAGGLTGINNQLNVELSPDGHFLAFHSSSADLNPLGGASANAGTSQWYLYDDADGSLTCASCPPDGSAPLSSAVNDSRVAGQPNRGLLADDGTLAFTTPVPLLAADQNTASGQGDGGRDIYEFRDGRLLLASDGLTTWPSGFLPSAIGITPSGHDLYFQVPAQYTQDAIDSNLRLYDARIGGGVDFPPTGLPPCDVNSGACEGPGTSPPDQPGAGSAAFSGQGNPDRDLTPKPKRCPKGKVRRANRCVAQKKHKPRKHKAKKHHKRVHANRRTHR